VAGDPLVGFTHRARDTALRLRLDAAATEALAELERAQVDALLFKGAALARWLYSEGQARGYVDCDILVDPARFAVAAAVLAELGYVLDVDPAATAELWTEAHGQNWRREPEGSAIDLHWRLSGFGAAPQDTWARVWAEREPLLLGTARVNGFGPVARTLHLATHAAQHGAAGGKPLVDLEHGLETIVESRWREASELAADLDALSAFSAGLGMVPAGRALAQRLELPEPSLEWTLLAAGDAPWGTMPMLRLRAAKGVRAKLRLGARSLVPPRAQLTHFYPAAAHSRRALVRARVEHAARAPWRGARGWSALRGTERGPG
jgi:hypothetical protein